MVRKTGPFFLPWVVHESLLLLPSPLPRLPPSSPAALLTMDWHSNPKGATPLLGRLMPLSPPRKTSKVATGVLGVLVAFGALSPLSEDHIPGWEEPAS